MTVRYTIFAQDKDGSVYAVDTGLELSAAEQRADFEMNYGGWANVHIKPVKPIRPGDTARVLRTVACPPFEEFQYADITYTAGCTVAVIAVDGDTATVTQHGVCRRQMPVSNLVIG